jgi:hypothetical protein
MLFEGTIPSFIGDEVLMLIEEPRRWRLEIVPPTQNVLGGIEGGSLFPDSLSIEGKASELHVSRGFSGENLKANDLQGSIANIHLHREVNAPPNTQYLGGGLRGGVG